MSTQESIETCPDDHHCLNGSKCVENPYREGSYYCDCQETAFEAAFEGLRCEHRADVYCVSEGISKHSFCTNRGICMEVVGPDSAHMGCRCPEEYEGSYCQFVKGSRPRGYPFLKESVEVGGLEARTSDGAVAGGVVVGFAVGFILVGLVVYLVQGYRTGQYFTSVCTSDDRLDSPPRDNKNVDGRDLEIEADGGKMKEALDRRTDPVRVANVDLT